MLPSEILFWGIISFLLGIIAASMGWGLIALAGIIILGNVIAIAHTQNKSILKYTALFLLAAFFGAFYFNLYTNAITLGEKFPLNKEIVFTGLIVKEPHRFERYQYFDVHVAEPYAGTVRIISSPTLAFKYGDLLKITGDIAPQDSPATPPTAAFPRITVIASNRGFWLKEKLLEIKYRLIAPLVEFLPTNEGALLSGITFGDRSRITSVFKSQMAQAGTTHLVALSGYNIAIIAMVVSQLFGNFMSRRKNFYLTNLLILAFVGMVGAESSVVRAAVMAFLILLAREVGRIYDIKNVIAVTAGVMALQNPTALVYDAGFDLSFASLLGIVYLAPAITSVLERKNKSDEKISGWKQTAITTFAAQLTVLPIALHDFGYVSLLAIVANVFILEFMPITMFFGFILAATSQISHSVGFIIAKIVQPLLTYEVWVIETFSSISFPVKINFSLWLSIAYYAALAFTCALIKNKSIKK